MNKTFKYSALWLVASALILTGCLERDYTESTPVLGLGGEDAAAAAVSIFAQNEQPDDPEAEFVQEVMDTVYIKTNRSWSAEILPSAPGAPTDWISIDRTEYENLAGYTQSIPIVVTCERNKTKVDRSAILHVVTPDEVMDFPITQVASVYTLDATAVRTEMGSMPDTTYMAIRTNTVWTAEVVAGATAGVTLALTEADEAKNLTTISGEDNKNLKVIFAENFETDAAKAAQVKVTVDGIEKTIDFDQRKASPYGLFRTPDQELDYRAEQVSFDFAVNMNWTMEIIDNNFEGTQLAYTPSAGGAEQTGTSLSGTREANGKVTFSFDWGADPGIHKEATLKLSVEGGDPVQVKVSQDGCIRVRVMVFNVHDDVDGTWAKTIWPFATPKTSSNSITFHKKAGTTTTSFPTSSGDRVDEFCGLRGYDDGFPFVTSKGSYEFIIKGVAGSSSGGCWLNSTNQGLLIGNAKGFIQFPALEGLKLTKVIWEPSPTYKSTAMLTDTEGTALLDANLVCPATAVTKTDVDRDLYPEHVCTIEVPDPQVNKAYRLTCMSGTAVSIKDLILVYEK